MTNADQIRDQQKQMWDGLAAGWDQHDAWFQRQTHTLAEWLCRVADLRSGQRILDLACGSGQPALTAARLVKPGGSVVATDLSEEMLRVARRKANMADLDNIEFKVMDMENIDFADETFDGATCRFGLMFAPDPARAVREVHRVLKAHRPFATTTLSTAEENPLMDVHLRVAMRVLGAQMPDPEAPTPLRLSDTSRLKQMLAEAGFGNIEIEGRPFRYEFNSFEDFWRVSTEWTPVLRGVLSMDAAGMDRVRGALQEETSKYLKGGKIVFPALAIGAYGQK